GPPPLQGAQKLRARPQRRKRQRSEESPLLARWHHLDPFSTHGGDAGDALAGSQSGPPLQPHLARGGKERRGDAAIAPEELAEATGVHEDQAGGGLLHPRRDRRGRVEGGLPGRLPQRLVVRAQEEVGAEGQGLLDPHPRQDALGARRDGNGLDPRPRPLALEDRQGLAVQVGLGAQKRLQRQLGDEEASDPHLRPPKRSVPGGGSQASAGKCSGARKESRTSPGQSPSLFRSRRQSSSTPSKSRPGPAPEKRAFAREGESVAAAKLCAPASPRTRRQPRFASAPRASRSHADWATGRGSSRRRSRTTRGKAPEAIRASAARMAARRSVGRHQS